MNGDVVFGAGCEMGPEGDGGACGQAEVREALPLLGEEARWGVWERP
ncbi:hypothetical protein ACFC8F_28225 [Streptomyces hydrogenans]